VLLQMRFASATRTRPKVSHGSLLKTDQLSGLRGFQESTSQCNVPGRIAKLLNVFVARFAKTDAGLT